MGCVVGLIPLASYMCRGGGRGVLLGVPALCVEGLRVRGRGDTRGSSVLRAAVRPGTTFAAPVFRGGGVRGVEGG
jgi:hypothetical protein